MVLIGWYLLGVALGIPLGWAIGARKRIRDFYRRLARRPEVLHAKR